MGKICGSSCRKTCVVRSVEKGKNEKEICICIACNMACFIGVYYIDKRLISVPYAVSIIVSLVILMINAFIVF